MTRNEAEQLRADPTNWIWGMLYFCPQDPRLIVRNNFFFGWAWNFGHALVWPTIIAVTLIGIGVPFAALLFGIVNMAGATVLFTASLFAIIATAVYISNGPR